MVEDEIMNSSIAVWLFDVC